MSLDFKRNIFRRSYYVWKHLASLNPALASSAVLLAGVEANSNIYDPFSGSGTIPIEAHFLTKGVECIGSDINVECVRGALVNAAEAGVKVVFFTADFRKTPIRSCDYLITDPPRGKRLRVSNLRKLFEDIFRISEQIVRRRLVLITPYVRLATGVTSSFKLTKMWSTRVSGSKIRILIYDI
ncbi:MAG TPA: hypothetical protein ENF55_04650 [Thermoprotei archaeon]|nr:hypothetical protein [Thermoprotei archaeon]